MRAELLGSELLGSELLGSEGVSARRVSLGEIASWEPGSFAEIERLTSPNPEIALSVDGELRATGRTVERHGRVGIEITRMVDDSVQR